MFYLDPARYKIFEHGVWFVSVFHVLSPLSYMVSLPHIIMLRLKNSGMSWWRGEGTAQWRGDD